MDKNRVLALTDGIVAIAATIMVVGLSFPEKLTLETLKDQWPTFFAYFVSFIQVYLSWRSHHNAFRKAENLTTGVFLMNGVWLLLISLIPFATGLIGRFPDSSIAVVVYTLVAGLWTLSFQFLDIVITKANPGSLKDEARRLPARVIQFGGYAAALVLGIFQPRASLIVIAVISIIMLIRAICSKEQNDVGQNEPDSL